MTPLRHWFFWALLLVIALMAGAITFLVAMVNGAKFNGATIASTIIGGAIFAAVSAILGMIFSLIAQRQDPPPPQATPTQTQQPPATLDSQLSQLVTNIANVKLAMEVARQLGDILGPDALELRVEAESTSQGSMVERGEPLTDDDLAPTFGSLTALRQDHVRLRKLVEQRLVPQLDRIEELFRNGASGEGQAEGSTRGGQVTEPSPDHNVSTDSDGTPAGAN
jgi:membrane protein implicated in regulation of membrane protease activity